MKLVRRALPLLALVVSPALADTGYKQLFDKSKGITVEDQIAIYRQLELKLAPDGQQFVGEFCADDPAPYNVEVVDLNKDGTPEVFVEGGNNCTSGVTGQSMWLFIKSASGYKSNLGFPAGKWTALPEKSKGFPDLRLVAATGPCDEVWRWNGNEYSYSRAIPTFKGGCKLHTQWGS
jgi:hypothetical protein